MNPRDSRRPLDPQRLATILTGGHFRGPQPVLLDSTGSTNADAAVLAAGGATDLTCVAAQEQVSGRGRLARTWSSPSGAGLWCSTIVFLDEVPPARRTWLPLAAGLAASDAIEGVGTRLKWPNDIVVEAPEGGVRKLGGVLVELLPSGQAVIGIGINVGIDAQELPFPGATSVFSEGGDLDRTELLGRLLINLQQRTDQWRAGPEALRTDYLASCATLGRQVEVQLPGGATAVGLATGIDQDGALIMTNGESNLTIAAGDVVHATI